MPVNRPPASVTIGASAAMSHRESSGSAAMSTAPSATSMYDQKSPYARLRQTRSVSATTASRRPRAAQPDSEA